MTIEERLNRLEQASKLQDCINDANRKIGVEIDSKLDHALQLITELQKEGKSKKIPTKELKQANLV